MLLNKNIDALTIATKKDQEDYYALNHIMVTKDTMYASNGHCLYWCENKNNGLEWPEMTEDQTNNGVDSFPALLPRLAIEKAIKNRPKKTQWPILENILLQSSDGEIRLTTTDLQSTDTVKMKVKAKEFPQVENIISAIQHEPAKEKVTLSIENLETLCKVMKKAGQELVTIGLRGTSNPVSVESADIKGAIMPMQL